MPDLLKNLNHATRSLRSLLFSLYCWNCETIYNLTLPASCISESCIIIKINLNFYFHTSLISTLLCGALKPFEAP